MMVRIEYEGGRTTLFDTLSFTEGSPFSGANMLTEFELEMREEPEKGLWLTANWHQVRDDWRADAPADGIPAARSASILDSASCIVQGMLPYGAQILTAIGAAGATGLAVSPLEVIRYLGYPYLLGVFLLVSVFLGRPARSRSVR